MKCFINEYYYQIVLSLLTGLFLLTILMLAGCGMIDFREKAIATETKVIGLDATVPSISSGQSFASIKLGYISTKYLSAPDGGKVSLEDEYKDCSLLSVSGTAISKISVSNDSARIK